MSNNNFESIGGRPSVRISNRPARTFVYIDGFNLYHAVSKFSNKSAKWCLSFNRKNRMMMFDIKSIKVSLFNLQGNRPLACFS